MEKRVLIAALLSGLVVVGWFALVGPPKSEPGRVMPVSTAAVAAEERRVPTPAAVVPVAGEVRPAVRGTEPTTSVLEGADLRVIVDAKGGVLRSVVLAGYRSDSGGPLELVRKGVAAPLSMGSAGPWNEEPHRLERSGDEVKLSWSDGAGNWLEKRVRLGRGRFSVEVEVRGGGRAVGEGFVVGCGVGAERAGAGRGQFAGEDAVLRVNGKLERTKAEKLVPAVDVAGGVGFVGVEDQYFLIAFVPEDVSATARLRAVGSGAEATPEALVGSARGEIRGTLFVGAKEHATLASYGRGLEETVSFGFFGFLSVGFLWALRWIYSWLHNWGVAIIVLTAGIRILLFPLNHKSTMAMRKMQAIQPKMKAIQERYQERAKKDPQVRNRMNQEVMQLYKQEGVNPMGGCLPMLVQMPILWGLYTLFAYAIELRQAPFVFWITDLSIKDPYYITPILMTATMVLQQRMTPQVGDPAQRKMFMLMPFIFGIMFLQFPAGLVLYWLVNNVLTIGQQWMTDRLLGPAPAKAS